MYDVQTRRRPDDETRRGADAPNGENRSRRLLSFGFARALPLRSAFPRSNDCETALSLFRLYLRVSRKRRVIFFYLLIDLFFYVFFFLRKKVVTRGFADMLGASVVGYLVYIFFQLERSRASSIVVLHLGVLPEKRNFVFVTERRLLWSKLLPALSASVVEPCS